jgi:hypothetical protein
MHETLEYLKTFARYPLALRRFLAHTVTIDEARQLVRDRLDRRDEHFLDIAERAIYGNPRSPYLAMLRMARCELPDLRAMVRNRGLENTLGVLRAAGVYASFEEFKGRTPIVREGTLIPSSPADFDSPLARRDFTTTTGGSTGLALAVHQDLDYLSAVAPAHLLMLDAWDVVDVPTVHWSHILPGAGLRFILQRARVGQYPQFWGSAHGWFDSKAWFKYTAATLYMLLWLRLLGTPVTRPRIVRLDEAHVFVRKIRETLDRFGRCLLYCNVSCALRVAVAAELEGADFSKVTIRVGGEPLTPAKAERIRRSGARVMPEYGAIETGPLGLPCARPIETDEVHLTTDLFAIITHPHELQGSGPVAALNLTSLVASSSKVMLNYQIDDYAVVADRACGCPLHAAGYTRQVHTIRSYSKLVGEGVTLFASDLARIVEEILPARFGGSPLDYQMAETEEADGRTRLHVRVHPRVPGVNEQAVIDVVLGTLRTSSPRGDSGGGVWRQAHTLRVVREAPVVTSRGKLQPIDVRRAAPRHAARDPR